MSTSESQTFIKALESSPVHCLNPRPVGNRRNPENGATTAMLGEYQQ
jgi:hypothetical protein